jgi:hypothetical protein
MQKFWGYPLTFTFGFIQPSAIVHPPASQIAQSQAPYNCLTREVWSAEKKAWCATHSQAQPPTVKPSAKPAQKSSANWHNCLSKEAWTAEKQVWCKQMQQLQNARYQIPDIGTLRLSDGKFSDPTKQVSVSLINQPGMVIFADFNRDGRTDAVSLLTVEVGGSGVFTYLSAAWNDNGVLKPIDPMFLGDRIKVNSLQTRGDRVLLSWVNQAPTSTGGKSTATTKTYAILMQPILVPVLK